MLKLAIAIVMSIALAGAVFAGTQGLPEQVIPRTCGVAIHLLDDQDAQMKQIADGGFGFVRMDIFWFVVETKKGVYDFSRYDALLDSIERHGLRAMFIVAYGNKLYSGSDNDKIAPADEAYRAAYARYAGATAAHFKGRGVIWEIWNEPNTGGFWQPAPNVEHYVAMAKGAAKAIHAADPDATVIGPTTFGIDFDYLQKAFKLGLLDAVDAVSVHPYGHPNPDAAVPTYAALQKVISDMGKNTPVISSEWGYSTAAMSEEIQAQYMTRMFLTDMLCGVPMSTWYDWHDDGTDPKDWQHNFGTVHYDFTPKPAYVAMQTLAKNLRDCKFIRRIKTDSPSDFLLVFGDGHAFKLAVWTSVLPHEVSVSLNAPAVVISDMLGKRSKGEVIDGTLKLQLDGSPKYVDCPYGKAALDLQ